MAHPLPVPKLPVPKLLTVAEYQALGETEPGYTELVEGRVELVPSPRPRHNRASYRVAVAIEPQLPPHLEVLLDVDVDLELAAPEQPGFSRRPDLIVARRTAVARVDHEDGVLRASDVVVVMETISRGSKRTDRIIKRGEYADAAIPHYWILDLVEPVSLLACHLAGELGYGDAGEVTGRFSATEPFPVEIDLDALL